MVTGSSDSLVVSRIKINNWAGRELPRRQSGKIESFPVPMTEVSFDRAGRSDPVPAPRVSIITIFFNSAEFLAEAIESVLYQTFNDWELILVDDGSTDGSTRIAESYVGRNLNIRYLEHPCHSNRGMSASRNLGLSVARGELVAFIDADDVWMPHKLEQQVAILSSQPDAALLYGLDQYWYSWTGKSEDARRDFVPELGVRANVLIRPPTLLARYLIGKAAIPCPTGILVRKEAIERVGGFEESFQDMYEDQALYAKLCLQHSVITSDTCWARYRQHPAANCAVAKRAGQEHAARQFFLHWLAEYLTNQGIKEIQVWQALQQALWPFRRPLLGRLLKYALARPMKRAVKAGARRTLPAPLYHWLQAQWHGRDHWPPVGCVRFGSLRRMTPISRDWGFDRGIPVDRYFIERFLAEHALDIRGHVLEVGQNTYTRRFGGDNVTKSDVLHAIEGNPQATIVGDITCAEHIPSETFDCVIFTQTLLVIYEVRAAIQTLFRILKPDGVLLVTVPGVAHHITRYDMDRWGDYWRFTSLSARRLFEEVFPAANVQVKAYGNVLAAIAFLHGLAAQELRPEELDYRDPDYEVSIMVRAWKPSLV